MLLKEGAEKNETNTQQSTKTGTHRGLKMNDDIGKYEAVTAFTGKKPISPKALELMKKVNAENAKATEVHNSKRSEI